MSYEENKKEIMKRLSFLYNLGFEIDEIKNDEIKDGLTSKSISYKNKNIKIEFLYSERKEIYYKKGEKQKTDINFFITVENKKNKNYFFLNNWAKKNEFDLNFIKTNETDDLIFIDSFLKKIQELFEGKFLPVIEGKIWPDIPFDWMGYK